MAPLARIRCRLLDGSSLCAPNATRRRPDPSSMSTLRLRLKVASPVISHTEDRIPSSNSSQCDHNLPAMPFAVAQLYNGPACCAGAHPIGAEPVVYQLSFEHSWLQHQRGVLEVNAGKERALTRQPGIWNFQRVIVACPIDKTAGVNLPSPMRIRIGEFWEDGRPTFPNPKNGLETGCRSYYRNRP